MAEATLLITNPGSRSGDERLAAVREALGALGPVIDRIAQRPEAITGLIREHAGEVARIAVGGGDGTVNAALDGLMEAGLPVGILPLGTANDFARTLDIPADPVKAVAIMRAGRTRRVDVAEANGVSFVNAIGIGLGPRMTRELDGEGKSRWGVLAYLFGLLQAFRSQGSFTVEADCDRLSLRRRCIQVTVANGVHYGGGMTVADDAKPDDGRFDVLLVKRQSRLALFWNALRFRVGDTRAADTLRHLRCGRVVIRTPARMDVTVDGEFLTTTPVECRMRPRALEIFVP